MLVTNSAANPFSLILALNKKYIGEESLAG